MWTPYITKLSFKDTDPIAGCGGPAPGILVSGGSDRMQDAWISWTLDHCHEAGQTGGASRAVFNGEGAAVNSFATGKIDLAYTAAGYGNEVGLLDAANRQSPRQAVAVPIGLNAAVIAVAGGHQDKDHVKQPYDDLSLTQEEVAGLLSGGSGGFKPTAALYARNPQLAENFFDTASSAGWLVAAPAEAEADSWFVTEQLFKNVPDAWKVPVEPQFGPDAGRTRGANNTLALADPSYALSLTTLSGRPPLANGVAKIVSRNDTQGGVWVLTDLETATSLGMTVVKIANQASAFVPVDQASVTAGVKSMRQTDNGLLLPDPTAVSKVDGATPYPLAFVEYALVPAEPLVNKDCTARTDSQALLTGWLSDVTGAGQQKLPTGMYPLTPELAAQAQTAIAQVGQAPVTGDCAGKLVAVTTTTTAPPTPTTVAAGTDGGNTSGTTGLSGSTGATSFRSSAPARSTARRLAECGDSDAAIGRRRRGHDQADERPRLLGPPLGQLGGGTPRAHRADRPQRAGRADGVGSRPLWHRAPPTAAVTLLAEPPVMPSAARGAVPTAPVAGPPPSGRRMQVLLLAWVVSLVLALGLVVFGFGPVFHDRVQRSMLRDYRALVDSASNGGVGLSGTASAAAAPNLGQPVGILEIGAARVQEAIVEGVRPSDTRKGPGHVPGTAGLGQPGNAVVVGRHSGFGGPFGGIGRVHKGDEIVATTTQGQSVYQVTSVARVSLHNPPTDTPSAPTSLGSKKQDDSAGLIANVYGPSTGDQLTLVTSASTLPWNGADATVVVAKLRDKPFPPTVQGGRRAGDTGGQPDHDARAAAILVMLLYGGAMGASVLLYKRLPARVAYLVTVAPIVAMTIIAGETFSRLFPAWM